MVRIAFASALVSALASTVPGIAFAQGGSAPDTIEKVFLQGDCVATQQRIYDALENDMGYGMGRVGIRIWHESSTWSENYEVIARDPHTYRWTTGPCADGAASVNAPATASETPSVTWNLDVLTPDTPPYLDGRAASVELDDVRFSYVCGRDQNSASLMLTGATEVMGGPQLTEEIEITLRVDGRDVARGAFQNYEGALTAGVTDVVAGALKAGNTVTLHTPRGSRAMTFPLSGSSAAIGGAQNYCG